MTTVVEAWRARPERERSFLAAGALVIGVMLYVGLVWLPLERLRTRLAADLPVLRASIVSLERDAAEVKRLRSTPSSIPQNRLPLAIVQLVERFVQNGSQHFQYSKIMGFAERKLGMFELEPL